MTSKKKVVLWITTVIVLELSALPVVAGQGNVVVDATDRGFYSSGGFHDSDNTNYGVGNFAIGPTIARNFFMFDLSVVTQEIIEAQLYLLNPSVSGYLSSDPTELYRLSKLATDPAELLTGHISADHIYDDLGGNPVYGDYLASAADNESTIMIDLTPDAILDLNNADGLWATGGALFTLDGDPDTVERLFANSGDALMSETQLVLTVIPAPGALLPLVFGMCIPRARRRV